MSTILRLRSPNLDVTSKKMSLLPTSYLKMKVHIGKKKKVCIMANQNFNS